MPQFDFPSFFAQSFHFSIFCCLFYYVSLYYFYRKALFALALRQKILEHIIENNRQKKKLYDLTLELIASQIKSSIK